MKKALIAFTAIVCFGFANIVKDIISELGITQYAARVYVVANFAGDFTNDGQPIWNDNNDGVIDASDRFRTPSLTNLAAIISGDKVAAAQDLCEWVKNYVNSEEFMTDYQAKRDKAKPTREPYRPDANQIDDMKKSVQEMEKDLAGMKKSKAGPQQIELLGKTIESQKAQIVQYEDPNIYLTRWNAGYPEDPAVIIRKRLNEYLELAATVDFNATVTAGRVKKFTNPLYEKKSLKWKAIYRAGREVNTAVTSFVKEWLKGEIVAANKIKMPKEGTGSSRPVKPAVTRTAAGEDSGVNTAGASTGNDTNAANTGTSTSGGNTGTTVSGAGTGSNSGNTDPAAPVKKVKKAASLLKRLKEKVD